MKRYDVLMKRFEKIANALESSIAPYIEYLDVTEDGYELNIGFWDGKKGSGNKMPKSLVCNFSNYELAREFLSNYLKENNPIKPFIFFFSEGMILD